MSETKPYYTLFFITLHQHTELCTGAAEHNASGQSAIKNNSDVDLPTARNGQGDLFIRGTSFTGALLDQARKLGLTIDDDISGTERATNRSDNEKQPPFKASRINVFNLYPKKQEAITTLFRQHVAINEQTGAAETGALYDLEVIPSQQEWRCVIEVDMTGMADDRTLTPDALVATVLDHWKNHYLFLGHRPAAGYGWFKVEDAQILQLTTEHLFDYPDNTQPITTLSQPKKLLEASGLELTSLFAKDKESLSSEKESSLIKKDLTPLVKQLHIEYSLECGPNQDEEGNIWGLDGFFIGGHELEAPQDWREAGESISQHFNTGSDYQLTDSDFPDQFFVKDDKHDPFIPSGSVRGVLRHEVLRSHSKQAKTLFGDANGNHAKSSNLYISPARLEPKQPWQGLVLHNHAEDEFTAGVYGSNKFCRTSIVQGKFCGEIILEYLTAPDTPDTLPPAIEEQKNALLAALEKGANRQLPIGAKQWVDSGWLQWHYTVQKPDTATQQTIQGDQ
ncbi:DUF324 domain-containing protein [Photobacterium marinum]|uniref:DUF324 domain-containing protein n=1 Tax=Photobacterium marinum TaxID=1056511 RepID=L8J8L1_9GAMM|nr:RAMP superfamily CRISPR-associated protein [Photobacterium marinum]ELR63889.1 DUF324 domain-containing protein [Photobacterium marinum]